MVQRRQETQAVVFTDDHYMVLKWWKNDIDEERTVFDLSANVWDKIIDDLIDLEFLDIADRTVYKNKSAIGLSFVGEVALAAWRYKNGGQ
uniref:Uncharacterized protein n=1 Tax=viral metagenome TaxID=1070528 RepID=A0A6M3INN4_9ZZZZ